MRREEQVTVQGPVKQQQPDGLSHRGGFKPISGQTQGPVGKKPFVAFPCERPCGCFVTRPQSLEKSLASKQKIEKELRF